MYMYMYISLQFVGFPKQDIRVTTPDEASIPAAANAVPSSPHGK